MVKNLLRLCLLFILAFPLRGIGQTPYPKWVDDLGGSGDSKPTGMITDKQNNIYISGYFANTVDFDPSPTGVKNLTSVGSYDIYVAKYTSAGALIWAVSMGGTGYDQVNNMTVDANGNPTIAGQYNSPTLTAGSINLQNAGGDDIFIIHLDTNGNILWGKTIGGPNTDRGEEVTADNQGNLISTSIFQSTVTLGGNAITAQSGFDALIAKFDSAGNLIWYINLGSAGNDEVFGVGTDSAGNIVVSGTYSGSVDFDPLGGHDIVNNGSNTPFIAKYTSAGKLIWVNTISGAFLYNGSVLSIDASNNIYLTSAFSGSLIFNSSITVSATGSQDIFIAKYLSNGAFQYAKDIGGAGAVLVPYQIRNDATNNVYITGYLTGTADFNPSPTATANVAYHGKQDFYVAKFDTNGNYLWAFGEGSPTCPTTLGIEMAVDNNNDVVVSGAFCSTVNFDASSCGVDNVTAQNGTSDTFIAKYIQSSGLNSTITAFTLPQQTAIAAIDQTKYTIAITVAPGTNIKALTPVITTTNNGITSPASGVTEDFTSPVKYTLNSGCSPVTYTVTVTLDKLSGSDTVCAGISNLIKGDPEKAAPFVKHYTWQVLVNSNWVSAPGVDTLTYYQTSSLTNNTGSNILYKLRRKLLFSDNSIAYDSFYNITIETNLAIAGNTVTPPAVDAFCVSGTPAAITGSNPSGGNAAYTYQWQTSGDGVNFTNITGATSKNYTPAAITATTYYRRVVTSGTCVSPLTSNIIKLLVVPAITNNTITAPPVTTICAGSASGTITGNAPSGGNGNYVFQWQKSPDNTTFTDIAGANLINFDPGAINATTYYRRVVSSPTCTAPVLSNVITVTVTPAITDNTITAPAVTIFCLTGDPGNIIGNVPSGGNGIYTYQWQSSTDNVNFTAIEGANATDYDPPVISVTTYYRRLVASGVCTLAVPGNTVAIVIKGPPAAPSLVTSAIMVCPGSITKFSVSSPVAGETYEWYDSLAKTNLLFTGITYVTSPVTADETFYVEAVQGTCISATLTAATVTVAPLPAAPQLVKTTFSSCNAASETLSILNPQPGFVYNWYTSSSGGAPVFTGIDFVTPALNANTTYYAETVNSMGCISASRTPAVITVNALPVVTAQGTSVCAGSSASLIATSTDQNAVINWYANATGGSILFTGGTFTTPVLTAATNYYAEAVDNTTGCTSSSRVSVPVTITIALGAPVVTVGAVTSSTVTFQWNAVTGATSYEVSQDNGNTFSAPTSGADGLTDIVSGLQPQQSVTLIVLAMGAQSCQLSNPSAAVTGATISPLGDYIYVPNAFTPNSDGKNDIVYVHSENIKSLKFYVYDQWGEMLYTSLSQQNGWDGTYKGTKEPVGVYVYYLEAIMNDGQQINKKGTITLLR